MNVSNSDSNFSLRDIAHLLQMIDYNIIIPELQHYNTIKLFQNVTL